MANPTFSEYTHGISKSTIILYENPDNQTQAQRREGYLKTTGSYKNVTVIFTIEVAKNAVCYGILGGVIGLIISLVTGIWNALWGIKVGAAAGAAMGVVVSFPKTAVEVQNSTHYRTWKGKIVEDKVSEVFKNFLITDPVLKDLICPISHDLPSVSVKAPDGLTYDQASISEWMAKKPHGAPASVYKAKDFNHNDLVFDTSHFIKIMKRIQILVNGELERNDLIVGNSTIIKDGLLAYMKSSDLVNADLFQRLKVASYQRNQMAIMHEISIGAQPWEANKKYEAIYNKEVKSLEDCFEPHKLYNFGY